MIEYRIFQKAMPMVVFRRHRKGSAMASSDYRRLLCPCCCQMAAAFREAVSSVSPHLCVHQAISILPDAFQVSVSGSSASFPLEPFSKVAIVAFGKASLAMAAAAEASLGSRLFHKSAVLAPTGSISSFPLKSQIFHGAHNNFPDEDAVAATCQLMSLIRECDHPQNIILFLISGGGSALFCSPAGVTLVEKLSTIRAMIAHGATIQELNSVRQGLSHVKGGKTLEEIKHAQVISLIMSDVIGDPVHLIASGPTVPSVVSSFSPFDVLKNLRIPLDSLPPPVLIQLSKSRQFFPLPREAHFLVASNWMVLSALKEFLLKDGYSVHIVSSTLSGDASTRGRQFARLLASEYNDLGSSIREIAPEYKFEDNSKKMALIFGGETTVEGAGIGHGKGGRSQHMVLQCLKILNESHQIENSFCFLSGGTDGQDGPTTAAGAIISNEDVFCATTEEIQQYLNNYDSFNFWNRFKSGTCHIITGPTGTNVMDIQLCLLQFK